MKAMSLAAALAFGTCLSAPANAQTTTETAPMDLTFERVFASPGLDPVDAGVPRSALAARASDHLPIWARFRAAR